MSVCFYADLVVYFVVGVLLVLLWKKPAAAKPEKPEPFMVRIKTYAMALLVGVLLAGARFGMQKYMGQCTVSKVSALLEPVIAAPKLADVVPE
jgi:amino acid transporter